MKDRPLPPTYANERARIEEHERFMRDARREFNGPICPDHYVPGEVCGCKDPLEGVRRMR